MATDRNCTEELAEELVMSYPPEAIIAACRMIQGGQSISIGVGEWDEYLDAHYRHEEATCH